MSCFVTAIHRPFSFLFIPFWKVLGTLLPRGQFTKDQLSYLLRQLDPKLGTPQATEFLEHFFPAEDYISCLKLRLFRKKRVVTPVGGLHVKNFHFCECILKVQSFCNWCLGWQSEQSLTFAPKHKILKA